MNKIPLNTSVVSGVALATFENETKILLLKRAKEGFWCHVAGKIENDEAAWQTIVREFKEETGINVTELYSAEYLEQFYEAERNCISIIPVFVTYIPDDIQICINEEHTEYKWCSLEEAKSLVPFPNQRTVYEYVWENFVKNKPSSLMAIKYS